MFSTLIVRVQTPDRAATCYGLLDRGRWADPRCPGSLVRNSGMPVTQHGARGPRSRDGAGTGVNQIGPAPRGAGPAS